MVKSREPELLAVGAAEAVAFDAAGALFAGAVLEPPPHAAIAKVPIIIARRVMFILIAFHKLSVCFMHSYLRSVALQDASCKPMFLGTSITASRHTTDIPHSLEAKPAPSVAASNMKQTELPKTQCDCLRVSPFYACKACFNAATNIWACSCSNTKGGRIFNTLASGPELLSNTPFWRM